MKLKAVNNNEFTVELSIFGEKLEVIFNSDSKPYICREEIPTSVL